MVVPNSNFHLTYCTNIHAGETWDQVFNNLKKFVIPIKESLSPDRPYGIGLRLSVQACNELHKKDTLESFKKWLFANQLYVFTINGFPYGGFHNEVVKENVHHPDWRTKERLEYTLKLFNILAELLPEGIDGGISTSPISYKYWLKSEEEIKNTFQAATSQFVDVAINLNRIYEATGKLLHLDIEPEPDGLLENTQETVKYFTEWLFKTGAEELAKKSDLSFKVAAEIMKRHIQVCYDVCHFAIEYENPEDVIQEFVKNDISIGKFQISAALKVQLEDIDQRRQALERLSVFVESTYLHQVIQKNADQSLTQYRDLGEALAYIFDERAKEWRIHFHVPIFLEDYNLLRSTQWDIANTLNYIKKHAIANHLEVETYTWDVLPIDMQIDLKESIKREMSWVLSTLSKG